MIFRQAIIPVNGLKFLQTNKTEYVRRGVMGVGCPVCGMVFYRPPSHLSRVGLATCSRACAAEARKVRIETKCVSCGKSMERTPSDAIRRTTCSKKCSTLRRVLNPKTVRKSSFGAYHKMVKEMTDSNCLSECEKCGTHIGPWTVRGLDAKMESDGEVVVNRENAALWCRDCHLKDVAPLGASARLKKCVKPDHTSILWGI